MVDSGGAGMVNFTEAKQAKEALLEAMRHYLHEARELLEQRPLSRLEAHVAATLRLSSQANNDGNTNRVRTALNHAMVTYGERFHLTPEALQNGEEWVQTPAMMLEGLQMHITRLQERHQLAEPKNGTATIRMTDRTDGPPTIPFRRF